MFAFSDPCGSDGVSEWLYSIFDGLVLDKVPPLLYMGYSPVMSLMCATKSCFPTGVVLEISAVCFEFLFCLFVCFTLFCQSGCSVVPVYSGMKIDHCIVQSPFGGRMFQEFLVSKSSVLSKVCLYTSSCHRCCCSLPIKMDEPSLARLVREHCFASTDFRADFVRHGFETTAANASQAWRGWRVRR